MCEEIKCKICNKIFSSERGLSYHITHSHKLSLEEYYLKYECPNPEAAGRCIVCGKPTPFISRINGYQKTCSLSCGGKAGSDLGHETMLKRYGKKALNNPEKNKLFYEQHPEIKKQAYEHLSTVRKEQGINELVGEKNHKKRLAYKDNFTKEHDCTMVYDLVYKYGQG